jgi:chromosome segregation ATPase
MRQRLTEGSQNPKRCSFYLVDYSLDSKNISTMQILKRFRQRRANRGGIFRHKGKASSMPISIEPALTMTLSQDSADELVEDTESILSNNETPKMMFSEQQVMENTLRHIREVHEKQVQVNDMKRTVLQLQDVNAQQWAELQDKETKIQTLTISNTAKTVEIENMNKVMQELKETFRKKMAYKEQEFNSKLQEAAEELTEVKEELSCKKKQLVEVSAVLMDTQRELHELSSQNPFQTWFLSWS